MGRLMQTREANKLIFSADEENDIGAKGARMAGGEMFIPENRAVRIEYLAVHSLAYSALAAMKIGISESASFQSVRKS